MGAKPVFSLVAVRCPSCGWTGKRREQEAQWWRDRETPTCPKCGHHPVSYERPRAERPTNRAAKRGWFAEYSCGCVSSTVPTRRELLDY